MKLIIQIPCFNEASTLTETVRDLPTHIDGIDTIEYLVIDDGSTDGTAQIAKALAVHHILRNTGNLGLARSFARGLDYALGAGADIIVNTDGDNQYNGADIAKLVQPIISGSAQVVIGDRQTSRIAHFSIVKKIFQRVGSTVVRYLSGVLVPDAVSGFRAISRDAAMQLNIVSTFSYTIEMLIQVGKKGMAVTSVPIGTNPKTRDSRLFKSALHFIQRSGTTAVLMYAMYQPLRIFSMIGAIIAAIGLVPIIRFIYYFLIGDGDGRVQSLVIGSALLTVGTTAFMLGLLADLVGRNRQLIETTLERVRRVELQTADRERALRGPADRHLLAVNEQLPVSKKLDNRGNT